jgi:mono/diheme cytochrome c family protein
MKLAFRIALSCLLLGSGWAGAQSPVQRATARTADQRNPLAGSEPARLAGAKLYARECAACHGRNREGRGNALPLDQAEVREAAPGALFWVLRNGSLRRGMPSFAHLPEPQRWQIITFLQGAASR